MTTTPTEQQTTPLCECNDCEQKGTRSYWCDVCEERRALKALGVREALDELGRKEDFTRVADTAKAAED